MNRSEIEQGIQLLCETSIQVKGFYDEPETLVVALNKVPTSELKECMKYYSSRSGVIVDLRKEVIQLLINGEKLTPEIIESLVDKHRNGKENQFRAYKQWFSIFYPPITFYGHNNIREFVEKFIEQLISDLKLQNKVSKIYFDFQGARQQGSDRLWLALYNKDQDSHSSGIQFFVEFYKGKIYPFKGELELWYQKHKSFILDMKLIFLTAWVIVFPTSKLYEKWFKDLPKRDF